MSCSVGLFKDLKHKRFMSLKIQCPFSSFTHSHPGELLNQEVAGITHNSPMGVEGGQRVWTVSAPFAAH